ncbi:MAG: hypothetical protein OXN81_12730, partial [Alphaproteobacteria bacterium]|nr:hypothetical protein [Alphaproteobacteria bacterium]
MIAVDTNVPIYVHRGETGFHDRAVSQFRFLAAAAGEEEVGPPRPAPDCDPTGFTHFRSVALHRSHPPAL